MGDFGSFLTRAVVYNIEDQTYTIRQQFYADFDSEEVDESTNTVLGTNNEMVVFDSDKEMLLLVVMPLSDSSFRATVTGVASGVEIQREAWFIVFMSLLVFSLIVLCLAVVVFAVVMLIKKLAAKKKQPETKRNKSVVPEESTQHVIEQLDSQATEREINPNTKVLTFHETEQQIMP